MPSGNTIPADVATVDPGVTVPFPGNVSVAGTLAVTGAASTGALTPASLAVTGAATVGTTLGVTGVATLTALAVLTTGFSQAAVARTATSDGLTTGTIADAGMIQHITVTSANANNIIVLPAPTPGVMVFLGNGATGYELRTSAPATISINGGTGSAGESAIAANSLVIAVCTSATTWQAIGLTGTTLAAVEAAAN